MSSRNVDFAGTILRQTEGRGVDVVLNSLTGEFIPATFSVLSENGRFLEIGKRDIWTARQVAELGRNIAYHVVDLGETSVSDPELSAVCCEIRRRQWNASNSKRCRPASIPSRMQPPPIGGWRRRSTSER